jgi:taurine--2-oxoglutarate transaminase
MGVVMGELMDELKAEHKSVGDVRNIGLFGVIELVKNRATKEPLAPYTGGGPEMTKLGAFLKDKGVYAFTWRNLLHTNPPLCVTEAELREVFTIINEALAIADEAVKD